MRRRAEQEIAALTAEQRAALGVSEAQAEQGIAMATTPWFRSLIQQDPAAFLRRVIAPVLALFGELDVQVAARENATAVEAALAAAGNPNYEVHVLPGLNHLFQHAATGGMGEYGRIEETFAPEALELVASWIAARFPRGR